MMEDPVLGKDFIAPVKSQGVRSVGDSVMTFRVKFTAKPGKHFVIRREAFRRITEALEAKGIYYAHRKVIVEMPETAKIGTKEQPAEKIKTDEKILKAGAAAGLETIIAQEGQEHPSSKK